MTFRRGKVYATIEHYYSDVPAARYSGESDYGIWWKDGRGGNWRVSWVHDTGDIYALFLGPTRVAELTSQDQKLIFVSPGAQDGPLLLLGKLDISEGLEPTEKVVEKMFDGWGIECGMPNSLEWITSRVPAWAGFATL